MTEHGFEIEGVGDEILKRFSKRSQERDTVVKEIEQRLGHKLSNDAIALPVHQSRAKKVNGISTAEVRERQLSQLSADERRHLQALRWSAHPSSLRRIALAEVQALNHAVELLFLHSSCTFAQAVDLQW